MPGQQTRGRRYEADDGGAAPRSHERERRAAARGRDAPLERAYKAGRRGEDRYEALSLLAADSDYSVDDLEPYYDDGAGAAAGEARAGRRQARREQLGATGARAGSVANDGAGILLGLFAYALVLNYLRFGMAGVRGWLSAKFINQPSASIGRQASSPAPLPDAPPANPVPIPPRGAR